MFESEMEHFGYDETTAQYDPIDISDPNAFIFADVVPTATARAVHVSLHPPTRLLF